MEYFEHLRQGLRPGAAAEAVGITRQTVYMHRKNDPDFAEAERQAELEACEIVEDALFNAAISGNVKAAETWLYNRMPDRWTDKRTPNIVNQIEAKQEVTRLSISSAGTSPGESPDLRPRPARDLAELAAFPD